MRWLIHPSSALVNASEVRHDPGQREAFVAVVEVECLQKPALARIREARSVQELARHARPIREGPSGHQ